MTLRWDVGETWTAWRGPVQMGMVEQTDRDRWEAWALGNGGVRVPFRRLNDAIGYVEKRARAPE